MRKRGPAWASRRVVLPRPVQLGPLTPTLLGGGGGPAITVTETFYLGIPLVLRFVLGGVLGVALFQASFNGAPFTASILAVGTPIVLPVAGSTVTITLAAGVYVLADYTGVI